MVNFIIFFSFFTIVFSFSPDISSFDAYGLKLAANDILLVKCSNSDSVFILRLAPYNYSLICSLPFENSNQFIYAIAVQRYAILNNTIRFVFVGINMKTDVPFIGSLTYASVMNASLKRERKFVFPCTGWQANNYRIHELQQFTHDESNIDINNGFFVVTVAPMGNVAYGFTKKFLIIYDLDANDVSIQQGNITWPDPSFLPRAVDISEEKLFVVIGYVGIPSVEYKPCVYLLNLINTTFSVLDTWSYTVPSDTSWQATLTNSNADIQSTKYTMSVSINSEKNHVLLGIPIMNTVILLHIEPLTNQFSLIMQELSIAKTIGLGKTVAWFDDNFPVVLVNTYSLDYIWSSSQIFIYNITNSNTFVVKNIIPNTQQTFAATFGPILLSLVVTVNGTMVILDSNGNYYILVPSSPGTVSVSGSNSYQTSIEKPCMAGTFASHTNTLPCSLCPTGTTTNGLTKQLSCVPCENNAICSLGAAFGNISTSSSLLTNIQQVYAYPISKKSISFDEILVQNILAMFTSSSHHCLLISPLFWAIIVVSFGLLIWLCLVLLKYCDKHPLGKKIYHFIKNILRRTDLIGDGKMVIGGLLTMSTIVLFLFTCIFSSTFLYRYPIEKITDNATFACDSTLINAQFSSSLMTTVIPPNESRAPIFSLLDNQPLTLHIDFINTLFRCTDVSVKEVKDTSINILMASCNYDNGILSISFILPLRSTQIQVLLADRNTIGALRIGVQGTGAEKENESFEVTYKLLDLDFSQTFSVANRLLAQQSSCTLQLMKVINHTYPLSEDDQTFYSAIWLPDFSVNLDEMFVDQNEYIYAKNPTSMFSIVIQEISYYILNTQKPIVTKTEMILSSILFIIDGLEFIGFNLLLFKLILVPIIKYLLSYCRHRLSKKKFSENNLDSLQTISCRL